MLRTDQQVRKEVSAIRRANIEREQKWDEFLAEERPLVAALEAIPDLDISHSYLLYVSFSGDGKKLAAVFRAFRSHGWKLDDFCGTRPKPKTNEWSGYFEKGPLRARVQFASTVCTLKQVGTKMIEKPVYEVVCASDEGSDAEVAASLD